jgi:hypothetical protein
MSFAAGFRTLQAVRDLRVLAAQAPVEARARIAAGIPDGWMAPDAAQAALAALASGDALEPEARTEIISAVRLAAALPNDDFPAFLVATMILLAEALERDEAIDDVQWYWQTFRGHYRVAAAVERAAIVQAIRRLGLLRGDGTALPETGPDKATASAAALRPLLERYRPKGLAPPEPTETPGIAVLLLEGLTSAPAADRAAEFWAEKGETLIRTAPPEILAGFRHLYESRDGWCPNSRVTIPLLDPPPGVDWPR